MRHQISVLSASFSAFAASARGVGAGSSAVAASSFFIIEKINIAETMHKPPRMSQITGQLQNPVEMLKNYASVKNFSGA